MAALTCIDCRRCAVFARLRCAGCYKKWRLGGTFVPVYGPRYPHCTIDGCTRPHQARGLCRLHYARAQRIIRRALRTTPIVGRTVR